MKTKFKTLLKKALPIVMAASVAISMAGCDGSVEVERKSGSGEIPKNLTAFGSISENQIKGGAQTRADLLPYKRAEEITGCKVEWTSPTNSARTEQFNLMIASGNYPDLIVNYWNSATDGAKQYAEDGVIVPISDYLDYMPNFKKFIDENPDVAKQFTEADGTIYYAPSIRKDPELRTYVGPTIRKDWLDKLGLSMPTNTDELYEVLKAFKTQDPNGNGEADEIPFAGIGGDSWSFGIGNILNAFNAHYSFYIKDGKIVHGMMEDEIKPGLEYMAKLYSEGLIDPDYLINDQEKYDGKILNDRSGFFFGVQPTTYYKTLNDGTKQLVGVPYFGGICYNQEYRGDMCGEQVAISTSCENPEGAARYLDWFYSEEGMEAMSFGIEGTTYHKVDGKRVIDEEYVFNNPNGLESSVICATTFFSSYANFAGFQLWELYSQTLSPWGRDAIKVWNESADITNAMPPLKFTSDEAEEMSDDLLTIVTYVSEQFNSIIIGRRSVDDLDEIRNELNNMGMEKILKIYNDAYARYLN